MKPVFFPKVGSCQDCLAWSKVVRVDLVWKRNLFIVQFTHDGEGLEQAPYFTVILRQSWRFWTSTTMIQSQP